MFKLVVLSALLTIAAAGVIAPIAYTVAETPTAISHQSSTVVHSRAAVSTPVVAPVVQKTIVASHAPLAYATPLSYASYGSPLLANTIVSGSHPVVYEKAILGNTGPIAYGAPLSYSAPTVRYVSSPLVYSAPSVVKAW